VDVTTALRSLGPGWFALVMATGIVSTAAARQGLAPISTATLVVAAVAFPVLAVLSLLRAWLRPALVRDELTSPRHAFAAFAVVAGAAVLGERLYEQGAEAVALALLAVAALGWLVLGYAIPSLVIVTAGKSGLADADGTWLLWVVATQGISTGTSMVAPPTGALGEAAAAGAVTTWAVGVVLYAVLLTLLLVRLLTAPVRPHELTTPYWIIMGATAISVLAGSRILELDRELPVVRVAAPVVEGTSLLLWSFGTWTIPLLVLLGFWRHVLRRDRLTYTPQLWALVFPLGMYSVATAEFGGVTGLRFMAVVARIEFWPALAAWVAVFAAMVVSLARAGRRGPQARCAGARPRPTLDR
jgi:tellurite resistance protein TehA-like permease